MEQAGLFGAKRKGRGCAFCDIVSGEAEGYVVFEDERSMAFFDIKPLMKGHVVLVPRKHFETFEDLPKTWVAHLFENVQMLSRAVESAMEADGSFVALNNKISQSVPHVHIHVVPRWQKDGLFSRNFVWVRRPYRDEAEMREIQGKIRKAVEGLQKAPG
ncbi:MAG: HIT family protein [Nitrospirota bacterium]|jgi:histidine triad (HIT) family protein